MEHIEKANMDLRAGSIIKTRMTLFEKYSPSDGRIKHSMDPNPDGRLAIVVSADDNQFYYVTSNPYALKTLDSDIIYGSNMGTFNLQNTIYCKDLYSSFTPNYTYLGELDDTEKIHILERIKEYHESECIGDDLYWYVCKNINDCIKKLNENSESLRQPQKRKKHQRLSLALNR